MFQLYVIALLMMTNYRPFEAGRNSDAGPQY